MDWNRHFILNDVFSFGLVGFIACIGNHFSVGYLDAISLTGISTVPKKITGYTTGYFELQL